MLITSVSETDFDRLTEIWEGAVRATHDFLTERDIRYYKKLVREEYLAAVELFAARNGDGTILGFMGMSPPNRVEMLFVDPLHMGNGVGTVLILHAAAKHACIELDVNEQNPAALAFYEKRGFVRVGRSALDGQGRAFPLVHMRLEKTKK